MAVPLLTCMNKFVAKRRAVLATLEHDPLNSYQAGNASFVEHQQQL